MYLLEIEKHISQYGKYKYLFIVRAVTEQWLTRPCPRFPPALDKQAASREVTSCAHSFRGWARSVGRTTHTGDVGSHLVTLREAPEFMFRHWNY